MGYVNRFLLFVYAFAVAVASLGVIALALDLVPDISVEEEARMLLSRWETIAGAAGVFLVSVHLLGYSLSGGGEKEENAASEAVLVRGMSGSVLVSTDAVGGMIEKVAKTIQGVRDAKADVRAFTGTGGLEAALEIVAEEGRNLAEISDAVRGAAGDEIKKALGFDGCKIDVSVNEITNAAIEKGKRVV